MSRIQISKLTAVPTGGGIVANTIYMVSTTSGKMEVYMSDNAGTALRRLINEADVQALIDAASFGSTALEIVDNIAARDALTPASNVQVYVVDASADATVTSGGATYIYRTSTSSWIKISEAESLDVVLQWANIQGKPTSSAASIDSAVTASHTHANKTQLDLLGQDGEGDLTYNGAKVANTYTSTAW